MKFKFLTVSNVFISRNYAKVYPYVPWRSAEVVQKMEEELQRPPPKIIPKNSVQRVLDSNPTNHTINDVGKFYTLPSEDIQRLYQLGGLPKSFQELAKTFNESCIMIRKPAFEVIDYLKKANYNKLPIKYVLYGPRFSGKSLVLVNIVHYAALNDFVLFHVPTPSYWFKFGRREAHYSESRPGLVDLPLEAAVLLKHFQLQNEGLVEKLGLKTNKEYVWNPRESTPAGTPLMTLATHGINRVKYACDCIQYIINELKMLATNGQCKVLFAIDSFNALYSGKSMIRIEEENHISTLKVTITQSLLSILKPDWSNGAIVLVVSETATTPDKRGSYMPMFLLKRQGFEDLDPFVPVQVPELTDQEFHSLLDYYEDRRWLQEPGGRQEIEFLTTRNFGLVKRFCDPM